MVALRFALGYAQAALSWRSMSNFFNGVVCPSGCPMASAITTLDGFYHGIGIIDWFLSTYSISVIPHLEIFHGCIVLLSQCLYLILSESKARSKKSVLKPEVSRSSWWETKPQRLTITEKLAVLRFSQGSRTGSHVLFPRVIVQTQRSELLRIHIGCFKQGCCLAA